MTDGFGRYEVYTAAGSRYCYRDSTVLKNRFGIRDGVKLKALEADLSALRQQQMLAEPVPGRFTANHLRRIHRGLLGDLYPFAGQLRREDILKGQTRFLDHRQIKGKLQALLAGLPGEDHLRGLDRAALAARSAWYMAELNYIHPFREGNGRAIREFMRLLYAGAGFRVDWAAVPAERLLEAMEESVYDPAPLAAVLDVCLIKEE